MKQARCKKCHVHYDWGMQANFPRKTKQGAVACCPRCCRPLELTTHLCKDPVSSQPPLYFKEGRLVGLERRKRGKRSVP